MLWYVMLWYDMICYVIYKHVEEENSWYTKVLTCVKVSSLSKETIAGWYLELGAEWDKEHFPGQRHGNQMNLNRLLSREQLIYIGK